MRAMLTGFLVLLAATAAIFVLLSALLYFRQEEFLFFPVTSDPVLAQQWQAQRVEIASAGTLIEGWWAANPDAPTSTVLLYFGGNAEDVLYTVATAQRLHVRRMLVTNYRGYGTSKGTPGQTEIFEDALAVYDHAVEQPGVAPQDIVVMGRSLGSAVATYLAAHRSVRAAILVTPFDSILAVAQRHYPFLPVRWLLRHPFPAAELAPRVDEPAIMLAGERDSIIPPDHAARLFQAWAGEKDLHILPGAGHNDIERHPDYYPLINEFLARIGES